MSTLAQIRTRCKEESDNVGQSFVSDTEWDSYINNSYGELYGMLAQKFDADYFMQSTDTGYTFTTDGVTAYYALPNDFFKLLGVDVLYGNANQWVSLKPFPFAERNKFSWVNSPIPRAGQQFRVFYIPRVTALAVDASATVDAVSINGWDEYIVVDAAMKALSKEESDVSVLASRKAQLLERLEAEASNRDAGFPVRIADVRGIATPAMQYHLSGSKLQLIGYQVSGWPGPDTDLTGREGWW